MLSYGWNTGTDMSTCFPIICSKEKFLKSTCREQDLTICTKLTNQPTYFHMETKRENPKIIIFTTIEFV
jgi:hypothetical protein